MEQLQQPNFSTWFQKKLKERNLTHAEFAERSGLSKTTISNLKNPNLNFRKHTVLSVKRAFGIKVSFEYLVAEINAGRDPETSSNLFSQPPKKQLSAFRPRVMGAILLLTVVIVSFWALRGENPSPIRLFYRSSDGQHIEVHREDGSRTRIPIGAPITTPFHVNRKDGRLLITAVHEPNSAAHESGTVFAFDSTGAEHWRYKLYDRDFLSFSPPYDKASLSGVFEKVFVGGGYFFEKTHSEQIWAYATELGYAASRFAVLDTWGKPIYSLWSWGRYSSIVIEDVDDDGLDEAIAIVTNNNLGKMVSVIKGDPVNDFYFNCVVYFEPTSNGKECIPGFFYRPDCSSESVKWMAIVPRYKNRISSVDIERPKKENLIRINSEVSLIYYVTPTGQFHDVFVSHEWLRKFKSQHTPALIMLRLTSKEIEKEIVPTCSDGENHFDLVYSAEEIEKLMTLFEISMPLKNYIPSYFFEGRLITDIDY